MKRVSLIVPVGNFSIVNLAAAHQILNWVNDTLSAQGIPAPFSIEVLGTEAENHLPDGLFSIRPEKKLNEVAQTDLVIVPAIFGDWQVNYRNNEELSSWILKQYKNGAEIATFCVGAFFLAEAGLLDSRQCSTHWAHANEFRRLFPKAQLHDERIISEDDGIYTSGGAYAFTNMILYLIEKFVGKEMAIITSKAYMINIERASQSPFIIFNGQKDHGDEVILDLQNFIEANSADKLNVEEVAHQFNVGRRTLERRFKQATGNTIVEYMQRVKIESAKKELEKGRKTVNEVMFEVGYSDTKAFRDVFRKYTGLTPIDYKKKFVALN